MRLVKLSTDEFPDEAALWRYFAEELPGRTPPGLFRFPAGHIADGALDPGETVLFSYRAHVRFVARAETGRMPNRHMPHDDYPNCFVIDLRTLRQANARLVDVEDRLRAQAGVSVSLRGQGWTRIPDSERAEEAIRGLSSSAAPALSR